MIPKYPQSEGSYHSLLVLCFRNFAGVGACSDASPFDTAYELVFPRKAFSSPKPFQILLLFFQYHSIIVGFAGIHTGWIVCGPFVSEVKF
jgi:hypothetical protein